jgi:hypothetical protein
MANAKKYRNELVNSSLGQAPAFTKSEVQYGKRFAGCVVITEADYNASGKPHTGRWDLKNNVQIGSATLIDYNYVIMCLHTYETIKTFQDNNQALVIFYNEITSATAGLPGPNRKAESTRPFCYLKGDIEAYVGTNNDYMNEDFAIVKIEWNANDFALVVKDVSGNQKLPKFTGPSETLSGKLNSSKEVAYIQQYSHEVQIKSDLWTHMSTHFGWGDVVQTDQQPANKSMSIYAYTYILSKVGASGSPVYNDKMEIIGIVVGSQSSYSVFLPLDYIYKCTYKSTIKYYKGIGISGGEILSSIHSSRKANEGW